MSSSAPGSSQSQASKTPATKPVASNNSSTPGIPGVLPGFKQTNVPSGNFVPSQKKENPWANSEPVKETNNNNPVTNSPPKKIKPVFTCAQIKGQVPSINKPTQKVGGSSTAVKPMFARALPKFNATPSQQTAPTQLENRPSTQLPSLPQALPNKPVLGHQPFIPTQPGGSGVTNRPSFQNAKPSMSNRPAFQSTSVPSSEANKSHPTASKQPPTKTPALQIPVITSDHHKFVAKIQGFAKHFSQASQHVVADKSSSAVMNAELAGKLGGGMSSSLSCSQGSVGSGGSSQCKQGMSSQKLPSKPAPPDSSTPGGESKKSKIQNIPNLEEIIRRDGEAGLVKVNVATLLHFLRQKGVQGAKAKSRKEELVRLAVSSFRGEK
eukprot:TRINITY_DN4977_c0_g1_i13.p1 TRINITY_DN4977_c0_g1~~TRINITY_DN4977_c0_g1_i13.p1  ORF type:complete len:439 (-),score=108.23 TRINITY_DN4977_c0_g1_i13:275-1414(-)